MHPDRELYSPRVTRRTFLGAAGALIATTGTGLAGKAVSAQEAPIVMGPFVWLDMDQAELDAAYDQNVYASNLQQIVNRYASNSKGVRELLGAPRCFAYAPTSIEGLDVFMTKNPDAPVHIFIHGGGWRSGLAREYAFLAELFVHAGAHLVIPDFAWVQDLGDSLMPMAEQVRRAVAWVYRNARTFGGDRTASLFPAIPQAVILPASYLPPIGAKTSTYRTIR